MSKRINVVLLLLVGFLGGIVTMQSWPTVQAQDAAEVKDPKWLYGQDLQVRKAGEANFTEKTQKFGLEVFVDQNNGNLIYISQTGSIAVVPSNK